MPPVANTRRFGAAFFLLALVLPLLPACGQADRAAHPSCRYGEPALPRWHAPATECAGLLPPVLERLPGETWHAAASRARAALAPSVPGYALVDVQTASPDPAGVFDAVSRSIGVHTLLHSRQCPDGHAFSSRVGPVIVGPDPADGRPEGRQSLFFSFAWRCGPAPEAEVGPTAASAETDF